MAAALMILTYLVGGVGIFMGFYAVEGGGDGFGMFTLLSVGIVGALSFVRHVIFHRSDAKRMGWETDHPDWMFEVGFANLAFGLMGFLAPLAGWDSRTQALIVIGYSFYMFQAALLHLYHFLTDRPRSMARFWRSVVLTMVFVGMMAYLATAAL
jgi:hypothetical protein